MLKIYVVDAPVDSIVGVESRFCYIRTSTILQNKYHPIIGHFSGLK